MAKIKVRQIELNTDNNKFEKAIGNDGTEYNLSTDFTRIEIHFDGIDTLDFNLNNLNITLKLGIDKLKEIPSGVKDGVIISKIVLKEGTTTENLMDISYYNGNVNNTPIWNKKVFSLYSKYYFHTFDATNGFVMVSKAEYILVENNIKGSITQVIVYPDNSILYPACRLKTYEATATLGQKFQQQFASGNTTAKLGLEFNNFSIFNINSLDQKKSFFRLELIN